MDASEPASFVSGRLASILLAVRDAQDAIAEAAVKQKKAMKTSPRQRGSRLASPIPSRPNSASLASPSAVPVPPVESAVTE